MFHGVKMCSLLISRRESLHRLNNHGVEVFTDLSQHDQFHAKSEKFSQGVNGRGIWNSRRENSNSRTVTVKKIHRLKWNPQAPFSHEGSHIIIPVLEVHWIWDGR